MMKSKSPRKQRKMVYQAPLHRRQKLIASTLSEELRKQLGKRSLGLRKGDEVKVMRGTFYGSKGKVGKIDLKRLKVFIDGIKRKKVSGEEVLVPFHASKLMITKADLSDKKRQKIIERAKGVS